MQNEKDFFYFIIAGPALLSANTLIGKVVKITDGDTVILLDEENKQYKIRLDGIDAPEKKQAYSQKSKEYLSKLIAWKVVTVKYKKRDRYGRILGTVFFKGLNINEEMLKSGYAWRYNKNTSKRLLDLQNRAKRSKLGLWNDENPIDPFFYRKGKK